MNGYKYQLDYDFYINGSIAFSKGTKLNIYGIGIDFIWVQFEDYKTEKIHPLIFEKFIS